MAFSPYKKFLPNVVNVLVDGGYTGQPFADAVQEILGATVHTERTHSGKHCFGKTPIQTLNDNKALALAKQLDRIQIAQEPVSDTIQVAE